MSLETLQVEFNAHREECNRDRAVLSASVKEVMASLDNKVSFKHFYWVIGILIVIQTGVLGYITIQIQDILHTSASVQQDVSFLRGKLSPYDVTYTK